MRSLKIGQPKKPDQKLAQNLAEVLAEFPAVKAAHFPMVLAFDIRYDDSPVAPNPFSKPECVLCLIFQPSCFYEPVVENIKEKFSSKLPSGVSFNVWPLKSDDPNVYWIERARSRILTRKASGEPVIEHPWRRWKLLLQRLTRGYR